VAAADPPARSAHPSIVSVGRLVPHKRFALLIDAADQLRRQLPDFSLHVIGSGPELASLRALVASKALDSHVTFHLHLDNVERDRLLATAWLSVNPSEGEGWGLSVIEANSLGVPVLAFRRPGLRDSIQ